MSSAPHARPVPPARPLYWLCQVAGWITWCALGILMARQQYGAVHASMVRGYALFFVFSIALTHLLRGIIHRREWLTLPPARAFGRFAGAALLLGLLFTGFVVLVSVIEHGRRSDFLRLSAVGALAVNLTFAATMWIILYAGLATWLHHRAARQQADALERGLTAARLTALEAQMSPHFLFNCLNSLRGMIAENPAHAQDMVTRLANILRHSLTRGADAPTESLAAQAEIVSDYLALESVRFDERLRTRLTIDPAAAACAVPAMALQTLVENAIKHGIAHLPDGGDITIDARLEGDDLLIVVENTGSLRPSPAGSTRVGLANLRERLRMLYGAAGTLDLNATPDGARVQARLRLPALRPAATTLVSPRS